MKIMESELNVGGDKLTTVDTGKHTYLKIERASTLLLQACMTL